MSKYQKRTLLSFQTATAPQSDSSWRRFELESYNLIQDLASEQESNVSAQGGIKSRRK